MYLSLVKQSLYVSHISSSSCVSSRRSVRSVRYKSDGEKGDHEGKKEKRQKKNPAKKDPLHDVLRAKAETDEHQGVLDDIFSVIEDDFGVENDKDIEEFDPKEFAMQKERVLIEPELVDNERTRAIKAKKLDLEPIEEKLSAHLFEDREYDEDNDQEMSALRRAQKLSALKPFRYGSLQIPDELRIRIDAVLRNYPRKSLREDSKELSDLLRKRTVSNFKRERQTETIDQGSYRIQDPLTPDIVQIARENVTRNIPPLPYDRRQALAYTAFRLPGVYGCNRRVYSELKTLYPNFQPESMLDFGSGPGTSIWAAKSVFPTLDYFHTVEPSEDMHEVAKTILKGFDFSRSLYLSPTVNRKYDVVHASYAMTELDDEVYRYEMISTMWQYVKEGGYLVILEPGTSITFNMMKKIRQHLIDTAKDFNLLAPCPHSHQCPISNDKWCSFTQRIERIPISRAVKKSLSSPSAQSWEDENFTYIIARKGEAKTEMNKAYESPYEGRHWARLILPPAKRSGHINMRACLDTGVAKEFVVSKGHGKVLYTSARKSKWGDGFEYAAFEEATQVRKKYVKNDWSKIKHQIKAYKKQKAQEKKEREEAGDADMSEVNKILSKNF
eukprot:TRINITY_DN5463_c0_g1_i1.p1 TRINITY_DN5463_c0_g1~~TRINITY_DN5463_c0_g1_i1.p1  ORF type:complete len:612 (-),score=169.87 TRINITY_DN5463_c0_g1_i1:287-2122(-)